MISTSNNKPSEVTDSNLLQREGLKQVSLNDKLKDNNGELQKERTLALISYSDDNLEDMLNHIEKDGFTIVKTKTLQLNLEQAQEFYADHSTQNYYDKMIKWLSSGSNICALILEKENAVKDWRLLMGPTNYKKARKSSPNSIRAVFYKDASLNATHGSDSDASVEKEIDFIFGQDAAKSLPHTHQSNVSDVVENQSMVPNDVNETEKVKEKEPSPIIKEKNVLPVESMNTRRPESDKTSSTSIVPEKTNSNAVHHDEEKDTTQVDKSQSEKAQNETKNATTPVIVSNEDTRVSNEKVETESISDNSANTKQANETISKDVTPIKENNNIETEEKIQTPIHTNETPSVTENMEKKEETTQPKEREIASAHKEEEIKSDKHADKKDTVKAEVEEKKEVDSTKVEEKKDTVDTKVEDKKDDITQNAEPTQLKEKENKKEETTKDSLVTKDSQEEKKATTTQEEEKEESVATATPSESSENDLSTNASTDLDNEQEIKGVDTTLKVSESKPLEESSVPIKSESAIKSKKDSQLKRDNAGTKASRDIPKKVNDNKETSRIRPPSIKKGQSGNISTTGISRPTTVKSNVTMNSSSGTTRIARLSPSATINKESSTNDKKKAPSTTTTSTRDSSGVPSAAKKPVTKVSRNLPRVAMIAAQKPVAAAKKVVEEEVEKKPKKKTSSTRSFISRLTAPTVASANKKAEADVPAVASTPKRSAPSSKRSSIVRPAVSSSKDISPRNNKQKKEEQEPTAGGLATMNTNETEVST